MDLNDLKQFKENTIRSLLDARSSKGDWQGELSSSALSTATAVLALHVCHEQKESNTMLRSKPDFSSYIEGGIQWLVRTQNRDGGWGDTTDSVSNISTTMLCWAVVSIAGDKYPETLENAQQWLTKVAGGMEPDCLIKAILDAYGKDKTFSVPILTHCTLAGCLGNSQDAWRKIPQLPFELAVLPQKWFKWLSLPVVSYALPALIAFGQVRHFFRPSKNPIMRLLRQLTKKPTLKVLQKIQPTNGGFLEAISLTSFVVMSLVKANLESNSVVDKGIDFILAGAREKSHWPIDTHLSTWVTTLSVNALTSNQTLNSYFDDNERRSLIKRLLDQQYQSIHPYTLAAPGGWSWTYEPGGVPDSDDTAGALLALGNLDNDDAKVLSAASKGVQWLMDVQNRDGGIPTFCKGWSNLPFDLSTPELTAHALLAWQKWKTRLPSQQQDHLTGCMESALNYLVESQTTEGQWIPLWFGNQQAPNIENPTYGTSRVIIAIFQLDESLIVKFLPMANQGLHWLLSIQNEDGGWGGNRNIISSIEETALVISAISQAMKALSNSTISSKENNSKAQIELLHTAVNKAIKWLLDATENGTSFIPSPIGLYFAKLWYSEKLYPVIFTASALTSLLSCENFINDEVRDNSN